MLLRATRTSHRHPLMLPSTMPPTRARVNRERPCPQRRGSGPSRSLSIGGVGESMESEQPWLVFFMITEKMASPVLSTTASPSSPQAIYNAAAGPCGRSMSFAQVKVTAHLRKVLLRLLLMLFLIALGSTWYWYCIMSISHGNGV